MAVFPAVSGNPVAGSVAGTQVKISGGDLIDPY